METIEVTITLNRAHKLGTRLNDRLSTEQRRFVENTSSVVLAGHAGPQQVAELIARRNRAASALQAWRLWNAAFEAVRSAVGRGNVAAGVADLLTKRESVSRELEVLRPLLVERPGAIAPEELVTYRPLGDNVETSAVAVELASREQRAEAEARTEALKNELFNLNNQVAEANQYRLTLQLPRTVASELGLEK